MEVLWVFEYLQMDCNGSGHIVGLVMSQSLIKIIKIKDKPMDYLH